MRQIIFILGTLVVLHQPCFSHDTQPAIEELVASANFAAPTNWLIIPESGLPSHIQMLAMGKGKREVPPTINLATEHVELKLSEYLKVVKEINESEGREWKELGKIQTRAGEASLSQVQMSTKWGLTRLMHAILIQGDTAYILTASSLEDEFTEHYEEFFNALQSLEISHQPGV